MVLKSVELTGRLRARSSAAATGELSGLVMGSMTERMTAPEKVATSAPKMVRQSATRKETTTDAQSG